MHYTRKHVKLTEVGYRHKYLHFW